MSEIVLQAREVLKRRFGNPGYELKIPELKIHSGEKLILLGDSGSGKSTALDMLALVLKPDQAQEFIWRPSAPKPTDITQAWQNRQADILGKLRLADLGYVLQTAGLLPFLTVRDNILLPADLKKMERTEKMDRLGELGSILKITHLWSKYPSQVSVGERQRCAIARAVIHHPKLILADEPTASLDPPTADLVFDLLLNLCQDAALVVATHDLGRATRHGFKVLKIKISSTTETNGGPIQAVLLN